MKRGIYQSGAFAQKGSVTVRTLHHYDRLGLLTPAQQTESGYRLYTDHDLLTLQRIRDLKCLGFSLEEILACLNEGPEYILNALERQGAVLRERRAHLDRGIAAIEAIQARSQAGQWDWSILANAIQENRTLSTPRTLDDVLSRLEDQLSRDDKPQYIPLIEKRLIKDAMRIAQSGYDTGEPGGKGEVYFRSVIQPLLDQITEDGPWPENTELDSYYEMPRDGVVYHGLGLSLEIVTPDKEFRGFSLPVFDLWYGRWI